MKQLLVIFIFILARGIADSLDTDVNHVLLTIRVTRLLH